MTLSERDSVDNRWAIVKTVLFLNFYSITFWMVSSLRTSIFAVASSIRITLLFFKKARHMQSSCFYPADRLVFETAASRPPLFAILYHKLHYRRIFSSSESEYRWVRSRFYRKVDFIRVGSWSIIVTDCRTSLKARSWRERPSMRIYPP